MLGLPVVVTCVLDALPCLCAACKAALSSVIGVQVLTAKR